jgi:hypothetical protein
MPLLPGTRIIDPSGTVTVYHPVDGLATDMEPGVEYRHATVGRQNDLYSVSIDYPNGYYSARLQSLRSDAAVHAGITLLAPLAALDRSAPVIDIDNQRIPVYQTRDILLEDAVTETNPFILRIDGDIALDTDGNGVYEDDYGSTASGVSIDADSIMFGPYETLGSYAMNLSAEDIYGNISDSPLGIEVYAPVPQIENVSASGRLIGSLDEAIANEPVHILRVRPGEGIRLIETSPLMTDNEGSFTRDYRIDGTSSSSEFVVDGFTGTLSPSTGLPFGNPNIIPTVTPASATSPLSIAFTTSNGTPVMTANIVPPT